MFEGNQSILIRAAKRHVYQVASTYPKFVRFFLKGSKILYEDEQSLKVQVCTRLLGFFPTKWIGTGIKRPFDCLEFVQEEGLFKGLKAVWSFRENRKVTVVKISTNFSKPRLGSIGEKILGMLVVEKITKKILTELKRSAENPVENPAILQQETQ